MATESLAVLSIPSGKCEQFRRRVLKPYGGVLVLQVDIQRSSVKDFANDEPKFLESRELRLVISQVEES